MAFTGLTAHAGTTPPLPRGVTQEIEDVQRSGEDVAVKYVATDDLPHDLVQPIRSAAHSWVLTSSGDGFGFACTFPCGTITWSVRVVPDCPTTATGSGCLGGPMTEGHGAWPPRVFTQVPAVGQLDWGLIGAGAGVALGGGLWLLVAAVRRRGRALSPP